MAIIATNTNASTTLSTGTSHLILSGVTQYSVSNTVIAGSGATAINYNILGSVASLGASGISAVSGGTNQEVFIGQDGTILAEVSGILLGDLTSNTRVVNDGSVIANDGIVAGGSETHITNNGRISGSLGDGISLTSTAEDSKVFNNGTITGNDHGIIVLSSGVEVVNSGSIQGGMFGISALDGLRLINSGTISSSGVALNLESSDFSVIKNTGHITGGIELGSGGTLFDTRGGTVNGFINFGDGNDTFHGSDQSDDVFGGGGNDTIYGYDGDDHIVSGSGSSQIFGGSGNDQIFVQSRLINTDAGTGDDVVTVFELQHLSARLTGGAGQDTLVFDVFPGDPSFRENNVDFINLASGATSEAFSPNIIGFENFSTTENVGTFIGTNEDNVITAETIRTLRTHAGDDTVRLRSGGEVFTGSGNDSVSGAFSLANLGSGDDTFLGQTFSSNVFGGTGDDILTGSGFSDRLRGNEGADILDGASGDDNILGQDGNDLLLGDEGDDVLSGGNDDDRLFGQEDNDVLLGDAGNDRLDGGAGDDRVTGGTGLDTFVFNSNSDFERVADFQQGSDVIDLKSYFFADTATALSNFVQQGSNVRIIIDDDTMVIANAVLADFDGSDILI